MIFSILVFCLAGFSSTYAIAPPEFSTSNVYLNWIDSTTCKFVTPETFQRIVYTTDGSDPYPVSKSTKIYPLAGIRIGKTCRVRARLLQGSLGAIIASDVVEKEFIRIKAPIPIASYGGNKFFEDSLICTLTMDPSIPTSLIRYERNGGIANLKSPIYTGPFKVDSTERITYFGDADGYDPSAHIYLQFTKISRLPRPTILNSSTTFSVSPFSIGINCPTNAESCRYSINTDPVDLASQGNLVKGNTIPLVGRGQVDSIKLRVQAFRNGFLPSQIDSATYIYLAPVEAPQDLASDFSFLDTLTVRLSSATPGALIRFTDDLGTPTMDSKDASNGKPIFLMQSDTLNAIALKTPQPQSGMVTLKYLMRLSSPISDEPTQDYVNSLNIHLKAKNPIAKIYYSINGIPPRVVNSKVENGLLYDNIRGIDVNAPGELKLFALAVVGQTVSDVALYTYTKKQVIVFHAEPLIDPPGQEFHDSILIFLTNVDENSHIRYSLSRGGTPPNLSAPKVIPGEWIRLDSSAILSSQTFPDSGKSSLLPSTVRYDTFTVIPSSPIANPTDDFSYWEEARITLKSRTRGGFVHYTVNDVQTDPASLLGYRDSVVLTLKSTSVIRTLVKVGQQKSALVQFQYTINPKIPIDSGIPSDTLPFEISRELYSGISIQNLSKVKVKANPVSLDNQAIMGMADISGAIKLESLESGTEFKVAYDRLETASNALYRMDNNGLPEFISNDFKVELQRPGIYFLAKDIQKPIIILESETAAFDDSTSVVFNIRDNISNPICEIVSPFLLEKKIMTKPDNQGQVKVKLKGSQGKFEAIWLRISAKDYLNTTFLPAEAERKIFLSQLLKVEKTPAVFDIGSGKGWELWDLVGVPVSHQAPLKWSEFQASNPGIMGVTWHDTGYAFLESSALLKPGMAWWVASRNKSTSLNLDGLGVGGSDSSGRFAVTLRPGWNEITSPSLERTYWPVTVKESENGRTRVKAPYQFNRKWPEFYRKTDVLDPWIGYYVRYYGLKDTTIFVLSDSGQRSQALSKVSVDSPGVSFISLELHHSGSIPVKLAAYSWAHDKYEAEDEPLLPSRLNKVGLSAKRNRTLLMTDLVHFQGENVHKWTLINPAEDSGSDGVYIKQAILPQGYEAWAVSSSRKIKFRIFPNQKFPPLVEADTLAIYAGPSSKLAALPELAQFLVKIESVHFSFENSGLQTFLRLELPKPATVEIGIWNLAGRKRAFFQTGLINSGIHRIPMNSQSKAQPYILRIQIKSARENQIFSQRIMW